LSGASVAGCSRDTTATWTKLNGAMSDMQDKKYQPAFDGLVDAMASISDDLKVGRHNKILPCLAALRRPYLIYTRLVGSASTVVIIRLLRY
jgi:hypothetical protein